MSRLKIGLMVSGMLAVMALSAAPAFAQFEAEKQLQGTVSNSEITKGGEFVYEPGRGIVKCPKTSPTIRWYLQSKSSSMQQYKIEWGSECTAELGSSPVKAKITPSQLKVTSSGTGSRSYTGLLGSNDLTTEVVAGSCTIIIPAGGSNDSLKETTQESPSLTSFEETIKVNTTGIHAEKPPKTPACPLVEKSSKAELKGVEFSLKGQGQR
jgi:hypothetical protein